MNKIPTPVTDKNGKQTTVHKNPQTDSPLTARVGNVTVLSTTGTDNEVALSDGTSVSVPTALLEDFRGTVQGNYGDTYLVLNSGINSDPNDEYLISLTNCCNATGKGMDYETGVGCRSCYNEVEEIHGGRINSSEIIAAA